MHQPITVFGEGLQTRSFCYVDDLIEGFIRLMDSPDEVTGPINLGNPSEFTIVQLAKKIIELTGSRSKLVYEKLPADDPMQRCPDISLAMEKLRWVPNVPLDAGLVHTIEYFQTMLSQGTHAALISLRVAAGR